MEKRAPIAVITGGNSGIGKATAIGLAKAGMQVVLVCRNEKRARAAKQEISAASGRFQIDIALCDLADLASVRACATFLQRAYPRIDRLINNAGGIFYDRALTGDGLERTFQVNHLGHFLLTLELLPLLQKSEDPRIINVSSMGHAFVKAVPWDDLQAAEKYRPLDAYGQAKLYNIYFTKELHRRFSDQGIAATALHPGVVRTNFGKGGPWYARLLMPLVLAFGINSLKGAETSLYLATTEAGRTGGGKFFSKCKEAAPSALAQDREAARRLWEVSEVLLAGRSASS